MCGIMGIAAKKPCVDGLLDGLSRLEYRGYDSAGIMVRSDAGAPEVSKSVGRLWDLRESLMGKMPTGGLGMGHTRWATHGRPNEANAHPHDVGGLIVVHNGIIDNFMELRAELEEAGIELNSDTDTEVIAHTIKRCTADAKGDPAAGIRAALQKAEGSYALVMWFESTPDKLWFARNESPMVLGIGDDEYFVASDPLALVSQTRTVIYLNDGDFGWLDTEGLNIFQLSDGKAVSRETHTLSWQSSQVEKGPYKHFMLKEIDEQPEAVSKTIDGLIGTPDSGPVSGLNELSASQVKNLDHIQLLACGTSMHAAMVSRHFFAQLAGITSAVDQAGEWRSLQLGPSPDTLTVAISQSGETADTLAALRAAKKREHQLMGIVNVEGSTIARMVDTVLHTQAGPEISVASTKAFTTQLAALYLLAAKIGLLRGHLDSASYKRAVDQLKSSIEPMKKMVQRQSLAQGLAHKLTKFNHALFLGRGPLYPIALEGALKLKEISYLHAEGYSAAEMKHGPIALIDENMATVMLVPRGPGYLKALGNLQEIKARDGYVIGVVTEGDDRLSYHVDAAFPIPADIPELIQPLVSVIPLQLLAYYVADYRGTDVDKPRNLAKSVTVE